MHLKEWLKEKVVTAVHVEKQDPSYIAGENLNGTVTLENILAVSCKTKCPTAIQQLLS